MMEPKSTHTDATPLPSGPLYRKFPPPCFSFSGNNGFSAASTSFRKSGDFAGRILFLSGSRSERGCMAKSETARFL